MCGEVDDEPLPHGRWGFLGLPVDTMLPLLGMVAIEKLLFFAAKILLFTAR